MEIWHLDENGQLTKEPFSLPEGGDLRTSILSLLRKRHEEIKRSKYYCIVFSDDEEEKLDQRGEGLIPKSNMRAHFLLSQLVGALLWGTPCGAMYLPKDLKFPIEGEEEVYVLAFVLKDRS